MEVDVQPSPTRLFVDEHSNVHYIRDTRTKAERRKVREACRLRERTEVGQAAAEGLRQAQAAAKRRRAKAGEAEEAARVDRAAATGLRKAQEADRRRRAAARSRQSFPTDCSNGQVTAPCQAARALGSDTGEHVKASVLSVCCVWMLHCVWEDWSCGDWSCEYVMLGSCVVVLLLGIWYDGYAEETVMPLEPGL